VVVLCGGGWKGGGWFVGGVGLWGGGGVGGGLVVGFLGGGGWDKKHLRPGWANRVEKVGAREENPPGKSQEGEGGTRHFGKGQV